MKAICTILFLSLFSYSSVYAQRYRTVERATYKYSSGFDPVSGEKFPLKFQLSEVKVFFYNKENNIASKDKSLIFSDSSFYYRPTEDSMRMVKKEAFEYVGQENSLFAEYVQLELDSDGRFSWNDPKEKKTYYNNGLFTMHAKTVIEYDGDKPIREYYYCTFCDSVKSDRLLGLNEYTTYTYKGDNRIKEVKYAVLFDGTKRKEHIITYAYDKTTGKKIQEVKTIFDKQGNEIGAAYRNKFYYYKKNDKLRLTIGMSFSGKPENRQIKHTRELIRNYTSNSYIDSLWDITKDGRRVLMWVLEEITTENGEKIKYSHIDFKEKDDPFSGRVNKPSKMKVYDYTLSDYGYIKELWYRNISYGMFDSDNDTTITKALYKDVAY